MRTTRNQDQRPSPLPPGGCVRTVERTHRLLRSEPDMDYGYELWPLVIITSAICIVFALSLFRPGKIRYRKALGRFTAVLPAFSPALSDCPPPVPHIPARPATRFDST